MKVVIYNAKLCAMAAAMVFLALLPSASASCGARQMTKARIIEWHDKLYSTTNVLGAPGGGASGLRGWAMMAIAMFDAANLAEDRKYQSYLDLHSIPSTIDVEKASPLAAAAKAAQVVLDGLIPATTTASVKQMLQYSHLAQFAIQVGGLNDNAKLANGVALGQFVGQQMLANRANDGHPPNNCNSWPNPPSASCPNYVINDTAWDKYQYTLPFFPLPPNSPGYPQVRPFGISAYNDSAYFIPDQLPRSSAQFISEWQELFHYATQKPGQSWRTTDSDNVAKFHDGNFGSQIGWIIDVLSSSEIDLDGADLLRVIALAAISSHDAHATHWYYKYLYRMARPITAYRFVTPDNAVLFNYSDPNFTPVLTTSQTPEYPSGHAARTGGVTESFKLAFGDVPPGGSFLVTSYSDSQQGFRRYVSFSQFQQEVQLSRTWGGVHWRNSGVQGHSIAIRVTNFVWANYLNRRHN